VSEIKLETIPFAWFTIHYILIIWLFDATNSELPNSTLKANNNMAASRYVHS